MSLLNSLTDELKAAMRAKDSLKLEALRAIKSAVLLAKTATARDTDLSEEEEIKLMNLEAEHLLSIEKPNYLKQLKHLRPDFISFVNEAHQNQSLLIELNQAEKQLPLSLKVDRIKILHHFL